MSWLLGTIAAIGWGSTAFLGFFQWRSRVRLRTLRQQITRGDRQLERLREEFAGRIAAYESELTEARAIARGAERSKGRFFHSLGDRTRDPLHTILGYLQLLERGMLLDRASRDSLRQIRGAGESLLMLLEDIREIVRLENHEINLTRSNFSLKRFLEAIESTVRARALDKGLQLFFCLPDDMPAAIGADERKLRQLLLAILDNAVNFTEKGRIILRVEVADRSWLADEEPESPLPGGYFLLFEVEDTGIGIPEGQLERLFDPYAAIEDGEKKAGVGLGLAIARRLARRMGGELGIDRLPGRGTLVKLSLPVTGAEEEAWRGAIAGTGRIIGLAPHQPEYRLLVADDRPENRDLLVKFLDPLGFQVREASNGQETISIWSMWRPHLIWLDTRMPVMDGAEAIQQIRHLEALGISPDRSADEGATVIIALVTGILEEEASALLALGCDDVLRKPFELEIVLETIARYLGVRYLYETDLINTEFSSEEDEDMSTIPLTDLPRSTPPLSPSIPGRDGFLPGIPSGILRGESLRVMSREWIERVHRQAGAGDGDRLQKAIDEIPEGYAPLAAGLTALVEQYNFRKIREFSQEALTGIVLSEERSGE